MPLEQYKQSESDQGIEMPPRQQTSRGEEASWPLFPRKSGDRSDAFQDEHESSAKGGIDALNDHSHPDADPSAEVDSVSQVSNSPSRAPISILVVDDDLETLLALESVLVSPDRNVIKAISGRQALQVLSQENIAVIVLDIHMPGMDGFEIAEALRQREKKHHIPIIFLTGYRPAITQAMRGYQIGAVDYLFKPVEPEILKAKVSAFVDLQRKTEEVKERQEQAEHANRELEAFSFSVSHDLRTPLRNIEGFIDLLLYRDSSRADETSTRYLKSMQQSAQEMSSLIDDLLESSRMSRAAISLSRVNLDQLVRETIVDLSQDLAGRFVEWKIDPLPEAVADRAMLHRVLVNYLTNAIKYTRKCERAEIHIGSIPDEKETIIFVRDNGVGFDMKSVDRLFRVFERLHKTEDFEGTGIGLASARRIIQRYGGRTWAEGKVNQGATFYFSLPHRPLDKRNGIDLESSDSAEDEKESEEKS
jgi:two-component system sensor histidine kinase/response regulator